MSITIKNNTNYDMALRSTEIKNGIFKAAPPGTIKMRDAFTVDFHRGALPLLTFARTLILDISNSLLTGNCYFSVPYDEKPGHIALISIAWRCPSSGPPSVEAKSVYDEIKVDVGAYDKHGPLDGELLNAMMG